jgi:hypothetical protein
MTRIAPPAKGANRWREDDNRWREGDNSFRRQVDTLKAASGIHNLMILSSKAGLSRQRLNTLVNQPNLMRVSEIRLLMILFRKYGMELDVVAALGGVL